MHLGQGLAPPRISVGMSPYCCPHYEWWLKNQWAPCTSSRRIYLSGQAPGQGTRTNCSEGH